MNLKKLKYVSFSLMALFLSACGNRLDCNQKDIETDIGTMVHNKFATWSDAAGAYMQYSFFEKLN